jgi:pyroglutamyl-peptidase
MRRTLLVTGFGPFPGAPFNPTGALVRRLARTRRPALSDFDIVAHVFPTSYVAVDRELPALIARHRPQVLLMFGLARRAKAMRVETRACNALARLPDAGGTSPLRNAITRGGPPHLALPLPAHALHTAVRNAAGHAELSRDAGHYLCNYLGWQAATASRRPGGLRVAAFIHVPDVPNTPRKASGRGRARRLNITADALFRAGMAAVMVMAGAARRLPPR